MHKGTAVFKVVVMPFMEFSAYVFTWIILSDSTPGVSPMATVAF